MHERDRRKGGDCFGRGSLAMAIALAAALPAAGQMSLQPGSTTQFKFGNKVTGPADATTVWASTPAPAGQLPSELLQIGRGLPGFGAQSILLSTPPLPNPPMQTHSQT